MWNGNGNGLLCKGIFPVSTGKYRKVQEYKLIVSWFYQQSEKKKLVHLRIKYQIRFLWHASLNQPFCFGSVYCILFVCLLKLSHLCTWTHQITFSEGLSLNTFSIYPTQDKASWILFRVSATSCYIYISTITRTLTINVISAIIQILTISKRQSLKTFKCFSKNF